MPDTLLTIGELARRAGVATSTVRFYERRGLLMPDARSCGQRRYRAETLRRLVSIGLLRDAGMSLGDIAAVLGAARLADWKAIGSRRLTSLDAEIARLQLAREYLEAVLNCRYDHPATECRVMGEEIDRRLALTAPDGGSGVARSTPASSGDGGVST